VTDLVLNLVPSSAQLAGLGAVALIVAAYVLLGGAAGGRARLPEADLLAGWAVAITVVTFAGVATAWPLHLVSYAVLVLAVAAAVLLLHRERRIGHPGWPRVVALAMPLLLLVAAMVPSQWDEFSNWLPNSRYLYEVDAFPRRSGPESLSVFPAYPYGLAIVTAAASRIAGHFVENATALFNVALLMSAALLTIRLVRMGIGRNDAAEGTRRATGIPGWGLAALGLLSVTALSPTFVAKIALSAYADTATAVAVGFAGVLCALALGAIADDDRPRAQALAWQLGLVLAALLSIKQVNLVLATAVLAGALIAAWRDPQVGLRRLAPLALPTLALPAFVYAAWRIYVAIEMPGGELASMQTSEWVVTLIPDIVGRMAMIATKKSGYFGVMLIAVVVAVAALRRVSSPLDRLAVIAATAFVCYNAFLLTAYVTVFGEYDALRAGSYWRYNMHLGGLALAFAALGLAVVSRRALSGERQRKLLKPLGWAAVICIVALPIVASGKLRFDVRAPKLYVRAVAEELHRTLPADSRLMAMDPTGDGFYIVLLRYATAGSPKVVGWLSATSDFAPEKVQTALDQMRATHVWVHVPTEQVARALGTSLEDRASHLLARDGDSWRVVRSWPYPGYNKPTDVPD
jgi:hypothetical protein